MSRVSIFAGQKPKPKESFKFLRRDEGRLSYSTATAESPPKSVANGTDGANSNRERRDSKSLREAIAYDMRNAKSHDPLGEVVVAVPRKAPPPTRAASAPPVNPGASSGTEKPAAIAPLQRRPPTRAVGPKKPEWVNPEVASPPPPVSTRSEVEQSTDNFFEASYSDPYSGGASAPPSSIRRAASRDSDTNGAYLRRYGGLTPRSAVMGALHYAAPQYEESSAAPSSGPDRNYFRRPPYTNDPILASGTPLPSGSRSHEEDELIASLEQEIKAAQEERSHYTYARQQLDREKQRFESYRYSTQQQIEDERADAGDRRSREQRDAQKDRLTEERCKNVSALLLAERETNRRLTQENDSLRAQLEDLTSTMRQTQSIHKAEVGRMRRDIDSLTRRNAELLAMAKEQQLQVLKAASASPATQQRSTSRHSVSCDASAQKAALPSYEDSDDENDVAAAGGRQASRETPPPVMDFTPRPVGAEAAACEKRNRQMQDRMQAEEEAMEERKRQREKWNADRKREAQEKEARHRAAVAAAAAATARRQREEEEQRKAAAAAAAKPVDERKVSGHPVNTPRVQSGAASVKRRSSANAAHLVVSSKRHHVPTREELLGDLEDFPSEKLPNDDVVSQTVLGDNPNKREVLYRSGKREIHYTNGTVKVVLPSGHTTLHFTNGDVKSTFPCGKSTYWYDTAQTMHAQMLDGVQTFEFRSTGQTEKHLPDGTKEILYPDGIYKIVRPDGSDETFYPNGESLE
uniref:Centromere protein J C-terminal domain-containing protein n=1 Tax=Leishmania guyanensis TaxID=5670 RepID=A0A1E1J946_LEIGU|nr:hypothetical protein, conserved [Leishmania guyanensis]